MKGKLNGENGEEWGNEREGKRSAVKGKV